MTQTKPQPIPMFPEFEAHLPDPAREAAVRRLRPAPDLSRDRAQQAALAAAVRTPALIGDALEAAEALPRTTAAFPHVVDRLALCWRDPVELAAVLDGLLFTERSDRVGFPIAVISELTEVVRLRLALLREGGR